MSLDKILTGTVESLFEVDLSEVTDREYAPPGTYKARLTRVEAGVSKSGNKKATWYFEVVEGEHAGKQVVPVHTPIQGKGAFRTGRILKAFGVPLAKDGPTPVPANVVGKVVEVTIREQRDNPDFTEVAEIRPVES